MSTAKLEEDSEEISSVALLSPACYFILLDTEQKLPVKEEHWFTAHISLILFC